MLNQTPTEAQNSAEFFKSYLEFVEELPIEIIKTKSLILELDIKSSNILIKTEELTEKIISSNGDMKKKFTNRLLDLQIQLQKIKTEKLHYSQSILERVESKARAVQLDFKNDISLKKTDESVTTTKNTPQLLITQLPLKNAPNSVSSASSSTSDNNNERGGGGSIKRLRRRTTRLDVEELKPDIIQNASTIIKEKVNSPSQQSSATTSKKTPSTCNNVNGKSKKKIKKEKKAVSSSSNQDQVSIEDENDETYCICEQVSYGEMILCENDACKIEWFHFSCVSLASKPKGRWYCPNCRGDRHNILNKTLRKKYDII